MDGDEPHESEGTNGFDETENKRTRRKEETLYDVLHRIVATILAPDSGSSAASAPVLQRIRTSVSENRPHFKDAARNTGRKILLWTRRGSGLRALLMISVGTITLLTLTGLLVFMLFFLAATVNAIVVSILISLAAAGGFLAIFFTCVTAVYIGALSVTVFVISTATISAIVAVLIATGWVGFFWTVWLVMKKSVGVAKHSVTVTGSAISAYSSARHMWRFHESEKVSD